MRDFCSFFERYGWPRDKGYLPFCIGHRGASGHERENTLEAFQRAAELGAEMWELDTQLTRDGVVVISHDDHLERPPNLPLSKVSMFRPSRRSPLWDGGPIRAYISS